MICQICLRTNLKHHDLDQQLRTLVTDLIDKFSTFAVKAAKYCTECVHMLRKFYAFRKKCILANEILQNWTKVKRKYKKPLDSLHTLVPQTCLGYAKFENCKVYFHQEEELIIAPPVTERPDYPRIVIDPSKLLSLSSTSYDVPNDINNENMDNIDTIKEEIQDYTENDESNQYDTENPIKIEMDIESEIIMPFEDSNTEMTGKRSSDDFVDRQKSVKRHCQPNMDLNYATTIKTEENTEDISVTSLTNAKPSMYNAANDSTVKEQTTEILRQPNMDINYATIIKTEENTKEISVTSLTNAKAGMYNPANDSIDREQSTEILCQPNMDGNVGQSQIKTEKNANEVDVTYIIKEMGATFAQKSHQVQ